MSCKPTPEPQSPITFVIACSDPLIEMAARVLRTWARQREAWIAYCQVSVVGEVYRAPELR